MTPYRRWPYSDSKSECFHIWAFFSAGINQSQLMLVPVTDGHGQSVCLSVRPHARTHTQTWMWPWGFAAVCWMKWFEHLWTKSFMTIAVRNARILFICLFVCHLFMTSACEHSVLFLLWRIIWLLSPSLLAVVIRKHTFSYIFVKMQSGLVKWWKK